MDARIEIHRLALKRILTTIAYMAGLIDTAFDAGLDLIERIAKADRTLAPRGDTLGRRARGKICRLLKPAESAARRLAIVLAQGITIKVVESERPFHILRPLHRVPRSPSPVDGGGSTPPPAGSGSSPAQRGRGTAERGGGGANHTVDPNTKVPSRPLYISLPALASNLPVNFRPIRLGIANVAPQHKRPRAIPTRLPIFDPAYRFAPLRKTVPSHRGPRIRFLDGPNRPLPRPHLPDDLVPIARLHGRIEALASALDNLPSVALRYARWKARLDAQNALAKALDAVAKAGKLAEAAAAQASNFPDFRNALAASAANPAAEMRFFRDLLARPRVQRNGRCVCRRTSALKVGYPPGCRRTKPREVDDIATDAHRLAWDSMHRRE